VGKKEMSILRGYKLSVDKEQCRRYLLTFYYYKIWRLRTTRHY